MVAVADPTLTLRAYGRTVAVTGPAAALADIRAQLPPTYRPVADAATDRHWLLHRPDGRWQARVADEPDYLIAADPELAAATHRLLSDLELWVAEHARRLVFVHAGCVAVGDRAVLVPGRSMSGKTSLVAA